jgi:hypothetical protein
MTGQGGFDMASRIAAVLALLAMSCMASAASRQSTSLDAYWRFAVGDFEQASQAEFDDTKWFKVTLPRTPFKEVAIDASEILDWPSFHSVFAKAFGSQPSTGTMWTHGSTA